MQIRYCFETAGGSEVSLCGVGCNPVDPATYSLGDCLPVGNTLTDRTITKITKTTYDVDNTLLSTEVTE